jgi:hypothetical protein
MAALRAFVFVAALAAAGPAVAAATDAPCSATLVHEGCGSFTWTDGSKYVGGFHGGYFDGASVVTYADGSRLEANFVNGAPVGDAVYVTAAGEKFTGPYHDVSRDIDHPHPPLDYPFWRAFFLDQADVKIAVIVGESGAVIQAQPYLPVESPSYRDAAVNGVMTWRYLPATVGGHAVKAPYLIEVQFSQPN